MVLMIITTIYSVLTILGLNLIVPLTQTSGLIIFAQSVPILIASIKLLSLENKGFHFPIPLLAASLGFVVIAIVLGECLDIYNYIDWWDTALHSLSGIFEGMIALSVLSIIVPEVKEYNPFFLGLFIFGFIMTIAVTWEIFEYSMDSVFGTNMQKILPNIKIFVESGNTRNPISDPDLILEFFTNSSGYRFALLDTMTDLICDFIGGLLFTVTFSRFYRDKKWTLEMFAIHKDQ
jgi:hypothetical protein